MFAQTSPLSSSYGVSNVNPYASYFGSPHQQQQNNTSQLSSQGLYGLSSPMAGPGSSFMSPLSAQQMNNYGQSSSLGSGATAPFLINLNSSQSTMGGGGGLGQSYNFNSSPFQPAQTRIIGGIHSPSGISGGGGGGGMNGGGNNTNYQQSPPRYYSGSGYTQQGTSPVRTENSGGEPMHYSPIQANSNQGFGASSYGLHNSPGNTIMLPSYLLGLDQPHHSFHQSGAGIGGSPNSSSGPGYNSQKSRVVEPSSFMSPVTGYKRTVLFDNNTFSEQNGEMGDEDIMQQQINKPKGPPKHGFGAVEGSSTKEFLDSPLMKETYCPKFIDIPISESSSHSSPRNDGQCSSASGTWITIFGFPSGASSFILTQFSTCGKIIEVKTTPGSNWLHIQYSNKIEARQALTKNGKVLGGSIMVGVMNSDPKIVQEAEKTTNDKQTANSSQHRVTPTASSSVLKESNKDFMDSSSIKSRIRPLATGSFPCSTPQSNLNFNNFSPMPSIARESLEVERNPYGSQSLPSSSSGIFTKAMEFMFGW